MTDFSSAVAQALGKLIDSGKIELAIQAALERTVTDIVEQHMRSYSDFGKELKTHVEEALKVDLDRLGLPSYNTVILDTVRKCLDSQMTMAGRQQLLKSMEELLGSDAPKEIKLSELVEQYKESLTEYSRHEHDRITATLERPHSTVVQSCWFYLDPKPNVSSMFSAAFSMLISPLDYSSKEPLKRGRVSHIHFRNDRDGNTLFIGNFYNFERSLFQMHAAGTVLVLDEDAIDRSVPEPECHCD